MTATLERVAEGVYVRPMMITSVAIDRYLGDLARRGKTERTRKTYSRHLHDFADTLRPYEDVAKVTRDDVGAYLDQYNGKKKRGVGNYSAATRAGADTALRNFFKWLYIEEKIKRSPMERMLPPKRQRPEDADVVTVSTDDVRALLAAAEGWQEKLALGLLAYLGPRRHAAATLRLSDYDRPRQRLRFHEKGSKVIWKPVPTRLAELLDAAIAAGVYTEPHRAEGAHRPAEVVTAKERAVSRDTGYPDRAGGPGVTEARHSLGSEPRVVKGTRYDSGGAIPPSDPYTNRRVAEESGRTGEARARARHPDSDSLGPEPQAGSFGGEIPPSDPSSSETVASPKGRGAVSDPYLIPSYNPQRRAGERDDRIVWRAVRRAADRAGVRAHTHSLRAAFATFYLEQNPGDIEALKDLMGHESILTTQLYLRRLNKETGMERVRELSWV